MTDKEPDRFVISNHQNQPVELHLATGVIVLPAGGVADVHESDLGSPQVQALQRHRLISSRRVEQSSPTAAPEKGRRGKTKAEG